MYNVFQTPIFGIVISVLFFCFSTSLSKKIKNPLLNPLLITIFSIILFLLIFDIDYKNYKIGADAINYFLSPITIVLAVPLYKQFDLLKKHIVAILVGIITSVLISFFSVFIMCKIMKADDIILNSIIPKSITTPMGVSLVNSLNGIESITIMCIILTGIVGSIIAPIVFKIGKIENKIAKGIGLGTSSHAVGTSKAIEMGEVEGAMSSLSIGICGIITVILVPILIKFI